MLCGRRLPLEFRLSVLRHHDGQDFDTFAGYGCLLPLNDIATALQNYNYERSIPLTGELDHARLCLETRGRGVPDFSSRARRYARVDGVEAESP